MPSRLLQDFFVLGLSVFKSTPTFTLGFMRLTPQPNYRALHVQPLIKTQDFMRFTLNHLHRFYTAHPKPSPWVLRQPIDDGINENSEFEIDEGFRHLSDNINQSIRVLCGLPTSTNLKNTQTTNLFTVTNYQHHIQLDKHRLYSLDLLRYLQ